MARLHELVERVAAVDRLVVSTETATRMIHAAGMGTTLLQIGEAPQDRDAGLPERVREAVLAAITVAGPPTANSLAQRAVGLKAALDTAEVPFTEAENGLLREYLDRLSRL
jgi:hypothetical protein